MASPEHLRSHVAAVQLNEHEPVHAIWQVEPPVQEALPLGPNVMAQVDPPAQLRLHDWPQLPEQLLWSTQASEQLPPLHAVWLRVQDCPAGQLQVVPEHVTGLPVSSPQATTSSNEAASDLSMAQFYR